VAAAGTAKPEMTERTHSGLAASGGIAIGTIHLQAAAPDAVPAIAGISLPEAIAATIAQLRELQRGQDDLAADIIEFQIELLEDGTLTETAMARIARGESPAQAFIDDMQAHLAIYLEAESALFRARAIDVRDLRDRVLRNLAGPAAPPEEEPHGGILVGEEFTPSAFLEKRWNGVKGVATTGGSPASHAATLARARGLPFVVGLQGDVGDLDGRMAIVDGDAGRLLVDPDPATLARYIDRTRERERHAARHEAAAGEAAITADGAEVKVYANIDDPMLLDRTPQDWFDGIGLARSELLLVRQGDLVDEQSEIAIYRRLFDWAAGKPTTIRLLDAGGDKPIRGVTVSGETNPFLGVRGIRLLLRQPDLLRRQLAAILAAAESRPARIMIPMVTTVAEIVACRAALDEVLRQFPAAVPVALGVMVETPALALTIEQADADFYSIGSNDLTQYVMAAARDESELADLQRCDHPAVLELVRRVAAHGRAQGREVSLCGDAAGNPAILPQLLRAGVAAISVPPAVAPAVKSIIRKLELGGGAHARA
jgi:phosphotransferase system enzyme I (PtsI)